MRQRSIHWAAGLATILALTTGDFAVPTAQAQDSFAQDDRYTAFRFGNQRRGFFGLGGSGQSPTQPVQQPRKPVAESTRPPLNRGDYAVPPSLFALVLGDNNAEWLAYGLDEAFEDIPELGVTDATKIGSGLIRRDAADWPVLAREQIAKQARVDFIVFMAGLNDRGDIKLDNETLEMRSDKWREHYVRRIDETIAALKSKGVPVFWVGAPPVRGTHATDLAYINDLIRTRAEASGITYLDSWNGFVNETGHYSQFGPDFAGQPRRLRTADGVYFTRSGARKLALYVEQPLRRALVGRIGTGMPPGEPQATLGGTSPDLGIRPPDPANVPLGIELATAPPRPEQGPVIALTGPAARPTVSTQVLAGGPSATTGTQGASATLTRGDAVPAAPGRADDFRWQGPRVQVR